MTRPPRRSVSLIESFNYAFEGIIHVLRTQRNMRIHFAAAVAVLIAALAVDVDELAQLRRLVEVGVVQIEDLADLRQ